MTPARALLAAAVAALALAQLSWAAPAPLRVTSVTPAIADRTDVVTLTGDGFGAHNLRVTLGGRPVPLLSATGTRATFRVPERAPVGSVEVRATNPSGRTGTAGLFVRFDGVSTPRLGAGAVSADVGRAGGTLTAGDVTLTVPPGALSQAERITMTPLQNLAGSPLDGLLFGGVKLEPEGLRFLRPAALAVALPAGARPADVLGFGSAGDGTGLHLEPLTVVDGVAYLQLWHFSTAGASGGGSATAAAMQSYTPSSAEAAARQRIAGAQAACAAEVARGVVDGPWCGDVRTESRQALNRWYYDGVRPRLVDAGNAPSFVAEEALAEWLAWEAEVRFVFRNDAASSECGTLQVECDDGRRLATAAVGAHAQRRLNNCTGTSLAGQIRDVARMADYAAAGALDLTSAGLPSATNGDLIRACAHLEIKELEFPAVAARNVANTLRGRVVVDVHSGPDRSDVPFTLTVGGDLVGTAADGSFQTTLTPTGTAPVNVRLEAEAGNPSLQNTEFSAAAVLVRPTRPRLELLALTPTTVPVGGTITLRIRVAGDGMAGMALTAIGGPGSAVPNPVVTDAHGEATAAFTVFPSTTNANDFITAVLPDGTRAGLAITVTLPITVTLGPPAATVATGGSVDFAATVSNSSLGVTWSATGGSIVTTGSTTARYEAGATAGTFSVTATSISDPTRSATATVEIQAAAAGRITLRERGGSARADAFACGMIGPFEGGLFLPISDGASDGRSASDESLGSYVLEASAAVSAGEAFISRAAGSAGAELDLITTPSTLLALAAGEAQASSSASGADPCVRATGRANVFADVTFDVSVASVPYSLEMLVSAGPGSECNVSFRRVSPTLSTLAAGSSDVSARGTLTPGRYELEVDCAATSVSPGGSPAAEAGYLGQLEVGA